MTLVLSKFIMMNLMLRENKQGIFLNRIWFIPGPNTR
jgi:hypothetical protein